MKIIYGIDVQESEDPYILTAEEAVVGFNKAGVPGAFLVDIFPILKHVPSWFPGAGFQRKAAHWRAVNVSLVENPFRYVKEQLVRDFFSKAHDLVWTIILQKLGKAEPCVATALIERLPHEDDSERLKEEKVAKDLTGIAYAGERYIKEL